MTALHAQLRLRVPDIDAAIDVASGHTMALLGRNGAGKSTILNLVAGLIDPDDGRIDLGDRILFGPGRSIPPHRRGAVLLTQRPMLFPHLTVRRNVAFGPAALGLARGDVSQRVDEWLARVDVFGLADRKPGELSGGQAARVALARALAADPEILLLDEPFAALDVDVADRTRTLLRELLVDRTCILVTHDLADAVALSDTAVVLEHGRIIDHGPTRRVLTEPHNDFIERLGKPIEGAADFFGG